MSFWVHSFRARRERDYAVIEAPQREHAMVVLAGWRFELHRDGSGDYNCYDPQGNYHGINASIEGGVRYALHTMTNGDQRPLHIWSGRPMK